MRAKTRQEIAQDLGINRKTLYLWLKEKNISLGRGLISPEQQSIIYRVLGYTIVGPKSSELRA